MSEETERRDRAAQIRQETFQFLSQRSQGQTISIEEYCRNRPDLMPDLADALESGLRRLRFVDEINNAQQTNGGDSHLGYVASHRPVIRGYQIKRELSSGGQGTVFQATQESTGRTVAIKVVESLTSRHYQRFEREVSSLASLDHPGIVSVIDRGRTSNGAHFLVMDYVAGTDLDAWITRVATEPDAHRRIVRVFVEITSALQVAHAAGIVHRDLKPSNVRVTPSGVPRIIDFGLAQYDESLRLGAQALTVTGNIVGSIPWASPEQAMGTVREIGTASDVYSLGVMLYQGLLGQFPYPVDGPLHETTRYICQVPPRPPSKIKPTKKVALDPLLWSIVEKCLAKQSNERYRCAGDLHRALTDYLDGRYIRPTSRKRSRLLALGALSGIAAASTMVWATWKSAQSHVEPLLISLPSYTNSVGMRLIKLPASSFTMGSFVDERGHQETEELHRVSIDAPFYLASTEVTRHQFRQVMGFLPTNAAKVADDCPVDAVTWADAQAFCEKLSNAEGRTYRLPTEAEWEYACRAGTSTMYAGLNKLDQIAWYKDNSGGHLHPVAQLTPNTWGFYDMEGNASEWVQDVFVRFPGDQGETSEARRGKSDLRVARGGSANETAWRCRSASRSAYDIRFDQIFNGFRVAAAVSTRSPTTTGNTP